MPAKMRSLLLALSLLVPAGPLAAQTAGGMQGMDHSGMSMPRSETAFSGAMDTMMQEMGAIEPTGDPEADFLLMMIPHHQSAVDMAQALLKQSDDDEVEALARTIINTQEAEITAMKGMLSRLGHPVE